MKKRGLIIFSLVFLSLFLFSVNFVSADSCFITSAGSCDITHTVMRLSSTSNAHGALWDIYYSYNTVLCCDFAGSHDCTETNKILGLYSDNNAHAQIPSIASYNYDVCYGNLVCTLVTDTYGVGTDPTEGGVISCPSSFPIQMVSLSSTSNAHIGGFNDYGNKICCDNELDIPVCGNGIVESANNEECDDGNVNDYTAEGYLDGCTSTCQEMSGWDCTGSPSACVDNNPERRWGKDGQTITETTLQQGESIESLVLSTFGLDYGSTITFTIYEIDRFAWIRYNTREIGVFQGTIVGPVSIAYINIDETFLNELQSDSENSYELIFEVSGIESKVLKITEIILPECTDSCTTLGYECGTHTICGVEVPCFDSCTGDEVCNDAGKCILETPLCQINSASWSKTSAVENDIVNLNVGVSNCDGQAVSFVVKENDLVGSDDVVTNPPIRTVSAGATSVSSVWTAEYQEDGGTDPEYFFTASIGSLSLKSSNELTVSEYNEEACLGIGFCADYTETQCNSDSCNVAQNSIGSEEVTCGFGYDCSCELWSGSCVGAWSEWANCNNGVINTGEQCDGSSWGPITGCSDFGYTGGTLSCNGCVFDTSLCTGKTAGECGNGIINTGEQCDTYTLPFTNCTRFDDFTGGILGCNDYCILNTFSCEGGIDGDETSSGKCIYTDNGNDNCEDGILERDLTATWIGEETKPASCANVKDTLICPAQIKVSFFGALQFIVAVLLVIIIYIIIKSRMKKPVKKKISRKSKAKKSRK